MPLTHIDEPAAAEAAAAAAAAAAASEMVVDAFVALSTALLYALVATLEISVRKVGKAALQGYARALNVGLSVGSGAVGNTVILGGDVGI